MNTPPARGWCRHILWTAEAAWQDDVRSMLLQPTTIPGPTQRLIQMSIIAILGAGTLGGTLAHKLAGRDRGARDPSDRPGVGRSGWQGAGHPAGRSGRAIRHSGHRRRGHRCGHWRRCGCNHRSGRHTGARLAGRGGTGVAGPGCGPDPSHADRLRRRVTGPPGRRGRATARARPQANLRFGSGGPCLRSPGARRARGLCLAERGCDQPVRRPAGAPGRHMEQRHDWRLPAREHPVTAPAGAAAGSYRASVATRPLCPGVGGRPGRGRAGGRWGAADVRLLCW